MSSTNYLLRYLPASLRTVAALVLIAVAALVARSWLASHDAATELRATLAAQAKVLQQAEARQQERDATLAKTLAAIAAAKRAVQTPAQAAAQIPQLLPPLPGPEAVHIELPPPQPDEPIPPPAVATVPQADLKPFYDYLQDCRACQAQLAAAKSDLEDERSKTSALTLERDTAVHAARGGFWSRVGHSAKWLLIGGAIAAIATSARN